MGVASRADVEAVVGRAAPRRRGRLPLVLALLGLASLGLVLALVLRRNPASELPPYRTERVIRGDLVAAVSATGNLEPTNQVEVGSEVSGIIEAVFVDDNARVRRGQPLARLDTARLEDELESARATLAAARARVGETLATLGEARAQLERLREVHELSGGRVPSATELATGEANVARAVAAERSARASVAEARAAVSASSTTLDKATVRSPVDGVVLARQIEPGQTVAASFQAPVLFTIAESLTQMELAVEVDEADVGEVREGQPATFTVDAYPDRVYPAQVMRLRLGAQEEEGVVSYVAELVVSNDDLSLRPGMTATASIEVARREGVLLVPNAALRFTPVVEETEDGPSLVGRLVPRPPRRPRREVASPEGPPRVFVLGPEGEPRAVEIATGLTDGRRTEVTAGLREGAEVITEALTGPP